MCYSDTFERKWQKSKEECELKDCSVKEMNLILEDRDRQNCDAMHLMRQEFTIERGALKEQAIQQESLVDRLERRVNELSRKEQSLHGKVKKYEQCMDAKRSLRHV